LKESQSFSDQKVDSILLEPKGIIAPVVTPFDRRDEVNERVHRELINFLLDSGIHGIFAAGSQGEFWALSKEEKRKLFEITVDEVNGRVPVYAGTGAESTKEVIELTRIARDLGADAVSIITPYFIKPDSEGLFEHYRIVASSVDIPVVVYINPARTGGVALGPDYLAKLEQECSNVVGIKDSSGDLSLTLEYITRCGKRISVLAGRDSIIFHTLVSGGRGAVSACANVIPKLLVSLYDSVRKRDYEAGLELQRKVSRLRLAFELGVFPEVIKDAANAIGFDVGHCRMPVTPLKPENRNKLVEILKDLDVSGIL
jgi:4-hydroxy-tetrahydrodipicolinate synthase